MMLLSAIPLVEVALVVLVLSAGKVAQLDSKTLALTVLSLLLTVEELDMPSVIKLNVSKNILKPQDVKNLAFYGTLYVSLDSMPLLLPALLTVLVVCLILEFPARNSHMAVVLVNLLLAPQVKMKMLDYAIISARLDGLEKARSAGDLALLVCINAGLYVSQVEWLVALIC